MNYEFNKLSPEAQQKALDTFNQRTEFGFKRTVCACEVCINNCRHIPGYLIPSDLKRLIPKWADPFEWAEDNLLASPGATVLKNGQKMQIPTLVPTVKLDGSCTFLATGTNECLIHEVAPFGCSFFDCKQSVEEGNQISIKGLNAIIVSSETDLYKMIWSRLNSQGRRSPSAAEKRKMLFENEWGK